MHSQWLKYIEMMVPVFSKTSRVLLGKRKVGVESDR